jgi:hypothetical protein
MLTSLSPWAHAEQICRPDTIRPSTPVENFLVEDLVVSDRTTGLMWQRCFAGLAGAGCQQGELLMMSWPGALQYVEQLNGDGGFAGFRDWRLPNIKELASIAEVQCANPAINRTLFPNAPSAQVWSSSPYNLYPHYSWFFDFRDLTTSNLERFKPFPVVLVRSIE